MRSAKKHWCSQTHHLILRSQERCIQSISVRLTDWSEQRFLPARLNLLPESSFHQQCHVSYATLKPSNIAFNSNYAPDFCIFFVLFLFLLHLVRYSEFCWCCKNQKKQGVHRKDGKSTPSKEVCPQSRQFCFLTKDYWELLWTDV